MNIYLSHARKDLALAFQLAQRLKAEGFTVLHPEADIVPGENWASKIGKALRDAEFMVFLFTPGAMESDTLRNNVELALGSKKYEQRVFSVAVASTRLTGKDVPWILLKQPHQQVESAKEFGKVAKEIAAQFATSGKSHA